MIRRRHPRSLGFRRRGAAPALRRHPALRPAQLFGDSQAGQRLDDVHPHLALAYPRCRRRMADAPDAARRRDRPGLRRPAARPIADRSPPEIIAAGIPFVDLGADFRLDDAAAYERWYHEPHRGAGAARPLRLRHSRAPPRRDRRRDAVAAAGCYPTAAILALKPLLGLIEPDTIIVDAASGVSGAGKALKEATHFNTVDENFTAYGLLNHRHTAEMEMALGGSVLFTPHLAPMNRGILATCTRARQGALRPARGASRRPMPDEPFIHVSERPPSTKWTLGLERRPPHRPLRRAHRPGARHRRARQSRQRRRRTDDPVRQSDARPRRGGRACPRSGCGHERHRRRRASSPPAAMPGSSSAATTWRWSRPTIASRSTAVAVFTQNKFVAPPVMLDRAAARRATAARRRRSSSIRATPMPAPARRAWPTPRR